jgi:hypothetical protein
VSDSQVSWWMDAHSRWHEGLPPPDWWQASDGRWHPPTWGDPTEEERIGPVSDGRHLAGGGRWQHVVDAYWSWPRWARIATPVSAMLLALGAIGLVAFLGLRERDGDLTATGESTTSRPEVTGPSSNAAAGGPAATTTTVSTDTTSTAPTSTAPLQPGPTSTTIAPGTAPPPSTTPPQTNGGVQLRAFCSPEGATAVSNEGVPVTCTTQKCHGAPYDQPRWRQTTC